jgi:hypothetical protein
MVRFAGIAALALAGCFEPRYPPNQPCPTGWCPPGERCAGDVCVAAGDDAADARPSACNVPATIVGETLILQGTVWNDLASAVVPDPPVEGVHIQTYVGQTAGGYDDTDSLGTWAVELPTGGMPIRVSLELSHSAFDPHLAFSSLPRYRAPSVANAWMKDDAELDEIYGSRGAVAREDRGTVFLTLADCNRDFVAAGSAAIPGAAEVVIGAGTTNDWYSAYGLNVVPGFIDVVAMKDATPYGPVTVEVRAGHVTLVELFP